MKHLPIKCPNIHDKSCRGFLKQPGWTLKGKPFCSFEINGFCGADAKDFREESD